MNAQLAAGIGILVLLFGGLFAVGVKLIGWRAAFAAYGIVAAIVAVSLSASYLIEAGTQ